MRPGADGWFVGWRAVVGWPAGLQLDAVRCGKKRKETA
jgi:hypothetical protein